MDVDIAAVVEALRTRIGEDAVTIAVQTATVRQLEARLAELEPSE